MIDRDGRNLSVEQRPADAGGSPSINRSVGDEGTLVNRDNNDRIIHEWVLYHLHGNELAWHDMGVGRTPRWGP